MEYVGLARTMTFKHLKRDKSDGAKKKGAASWRLSASYLGALAKRKVMRMKKFDDTALDDYSVHWRQSQVQQVSSSAAATLRDFRSLRPCTAVDAAVCFAADAALCVHGCVRVLVGTHLQPCASASRGRRCCACDSLQIASALCDGICKSVKAVPLFRWIRRCDCPVACSASHPLMEYGEVLV